MSHRIEPVGPRRDAAPVERVLLGPVEREAERERREERRRRKQAQQRPSQAPREGGLDVRA